MKSYSIDRRMKGDGVHFYVRFKDEDTGKYGTAKCVDVLGRKLGLSKTHVTKLPIANQITIKAQEVGLDGNEKMEILYLLISLKRSGIMTPQNM